MRLRLVPADRVAVALMGNLEVARLRPLAESIADAVLAAARPFDRERDLISLHDDHAPDQDDGDGDASSPAPGEEAGNLDEGGRAQQRWDTER
jgi:hypothetical protein